MASAFRNGRDTICQGRSGKRKKGKKKTDIITKYRGMRYAAVLSFFFLEGWNQLSRSA